MLPDTSDNICVLEKQLRAVFLLAERSPEGKLPFVRCQQFFQIGDDLFMRLLRIEPSATTQHRDKVGFDTLLGHRGDLLKMEKEVSGLYLSGHPLDAYRSQIAQVSTCTIAQLLGEDAKQFDNQNVTLVCTIVRNKIMTTKSNTLMAFTTVEDLTGSMELLVFPRILAECRAALQENAVVVANGRVSVKEDEAARLIVEGVQSIETYDPAQSFGRNRVERVKRETSGGGAAGYFLTVPARDCPQMHKVENLLCNIFDGGTVKVYFRFRDTGKAMLARHMAVRDDPLLRAELERILGKDCVKIQDIEQSAK